MSNHLAIATVTAALSRDLQAAVGADVPGALVTMVRPDDTGVSQMGVNIFLYQVTPNAAQRNHDLPTRRPDGTMVLQPQAAIDLHYLLSFYGNEVELEPQRLLGSTIRALHTRPLLTRASVRSTIDALAFLDDSDLDEELESVKFTPVPFNLEELSKLWSVFFQTPYVLSVAYQASAVLISTEQRPFMPQPVLEPVIEVQPSVELGVPAAEPDSLDDLQVWLRADADFTHDDEGLVSQWDDQSGNGNNAFQAGDPRPSLVRNAVSGRPAMRFDGQDDRFAIADMQYNALGQIGGITIFALVRSVSTDDQILAGFDRDEYWRFSLRTGDEDGVGWHTRSQAGDVHDLVTDTPLTDGRWHLIVCRFEAGASPDKQIFVDCGQAVSADAHGGANLGSGVTRFGFIGVASEAGVANGPIGPGQFLAGDLAEFLIYNRALTEEERQGIERYFIEKYSSP